MFWLTGNIQSFSIRDSGFSVVLYDLGNSWPSLIATASGHNSRLAIRDSGSSAYVFHESCKHGDAASAFLDNILGFSTMSQRTCLFQLSLAVILGFEMYPGVDMYPGAEFAEVVEEDVNAVAKYFGHD